MDSPNFLNYMVGARGIEPLTSSVSRKRSPTELRACKKIFNLNIVKLVKAYNKNKSMNLERRKEIRYFI